LNKLSREQGETKRWTIRKAIFIVGGMGLMFLLFAAKRNTFAQGTKLSFKAQQWAS